MSQSQRVMRWRLILEEFGPDIQHISGEDNIVADAMSRLPTTNQDQRELRTDAQGLSSETLAEMEQLIFEKNDPFPLNLSLVRKIQQHELNINKTLKKW